MPLRTGVIGTGTVVQNNHFPAVRRNPRIQLTAVCDVDGERAREAGFEHGARPYTAAESMFEAEDLDWVHVATPVATHRELVAQAIEAGVPTTVQKPATVTLEELEELLALSDERGVPVSVVHNWLYYPVIREARRRVERGDIGRVRAVETTFAGEGPPDETYRGEWVFDLPGGEFEEGMPHPLYLTQAFGGDPSSLNAVDVCARRFDEYDSDIAYDGLTLQYAADGGTISTVTFLTGGANGQWMRIHGDDGSLAVDFPSRSIRYYDAERGPYHLLRERLDSNAEDVRSAVRGLTRNLWVRGKEVLEEDLGHHSENSWNGHYYLFNEVAKALERGEQPPLPLERARWTTGIMERVREAAMGEEPLPESEL